MPQHGPPPVLRLLAHLSDLHFGRVDAGLLDPLAAALDGIKPHLVVVSGDLTQRARRRQFREVRAFLERLPAPRIVVPGNHDVPLYDVLNRFLRPLARYRRYISEDTEPFYCDDEIAVAGLNTARSLTIQGGRINREQLARLRDRLAPLDPRLMRIVVTHHPFDAPDGAEPRKLVGRAVMAMEALAASGVHICLAGHLHVAHIGHAATRYVLAGHGALIVQAGTATSTRGRGERNSFNVLRIDGAWLDVVRYESVDSRGFEVAEVSRFQHDAGGWQSRELPA